MFEAVLISLIFVIVVSFSILLVRFIILFLKHDLRINRLLIIAMFSFVFGILYDCFRVVAYIFLDFVDLAADRFFFSIKFFFIFVGVAAMTRVVFMLNQQSGRKLKFESVIRYSVIAAAGILSIVNAFTFSERFITGFPGFYTFRIDQTLFLIITGLSIPFMAFLTIRMNLILKELRDKTIKKQMIFLLFIFVFLMIERFYSIGSSFVPHSLDLLIVEYAWIAFVSVSSLVIFLKYPDMLEMISLYFCVKSIYIIKKKGGQLLFGFDFHKEKEQESITYEKLLLGGFLYAVCRGLEVTLRLSGDLELIQVEDLNLLFKQGKHVVGLVFATENLPTTDLKLLYLLQKFERQYETNLVHWTGDLSEFQTETLEAWMYEIFRPGLKNIGKP